MAEDEEMAGAAGRLEEALNRIARATKNRGGGTQGDGRGDAKMDVVAERLDALILELRSALEQGRDEAS